MSTYADETVLEQLELTMVGNDLLSENRFLRLNVKKGRSAWW